MIINIYLTHDQKVQLNAMSQKYKVSISTIADNVLFYLTKGIIQSYEGEKIAAEQISTIQEIKNGQIYKDKGQKKTSIKPKGEIVKFKFYNNLRYAYNNAIKIYLHKDLDKYLTKEQINYFYQSLNTALQKTIEPNYEYNKFIRNMARYERGKEWKT